MLYRFDIPVPSYYNDEVFQQHLYLEADHSPTKEEVKTVLTGLDVRDSEYLEYTQIWKACLKSVDNIEEFPMLFGNCVRKNSFVNVELSIIADTLQVATTARAPFTVCIIEPIVI